MRVACPTRQIFLNFFIPIICGEVYKLYTCTLFNSVRPHVSVPTLILFFLLSLRNDVYNIKGLDIQRTVHRDIFLYRGADKSLTRPGRKQANVSVRMAWISFSALPCMGGTSQFASRCCWNRARPWHASEVISFLIGLRTYQHPGNKSQRDALFLKFILIKNSTCFGQTNCPSSGVSTNFT